MHELAVTQEIISLVKAECLKNDIAHPKKIILELGLLTSFRKESIIFYYEALKKENKLLVGTELEINEIKGEIFCNLCNNQSQIEKQYMALCPLCDSVDVDIIHGKEFKVKDIVTD